MKGFNRIRRSGEEIPYETGYESLRTETRFRPRTSEMSPDVQRAERNLEEIRRRMPEVVAAREKVLEAFDKAEKRALKSAGIKV